MGEADVGAAVDQVVAMLRDAGRSEGTVRQHGVVVERFAAFLTGRGLDTAGEGVCIDFIANQTGIRLESLRGSFQGRDVQAVRRPVVLMADVLAGRPVDVSRAVIARRDHCPARFRPLRDDYLAACRTRGNAEATVVTKDKAASKFLAYLDQAGAGDLSVLGVRDVSGFLLRQSHLRRKTVAVLRSCLADFLSFLSATRKAPAGLADRLPPHRHVRGESEPHLWTADEIHPVVFHRVLDLLDVAGWQVRQEEGGLTVLVAGGQFEAGAVVDRLRAELRHAGVGPLPVRLETVRAIPPGAAGKRPLVLAERAPG